MSGQLPADFDAAMDGAQLPQMPQMAASSQAPSVPGGGSPGGTGATQAEQQLVMILATLQQNQQAILQMMREQTEQRQQSQSSLESLRGKDLTKALNPPPAFEAKTRDEELAKWSAWSWQFEAWLGTLDPGFATGLELIKSQGSNEIKMSTLSVKDQERSQLLFGILSGLLHERGKRSLRAITDRNGFEAYRALLVDLLPGSRSRLLALLQVINSWPSFDQKQGFSQQMLKLEAAFGEYDSQSTVALSEDIKIACLLRCVTGQLKQHLNVAVTEKTKYSDLRQLVLRWDNAQTRWDTAVAATYALGDGRGSGGQPMDVDAIGAVSWKGKGKGKNKGKDKGKSKGKGKDGKGKGNKGKDQSKGSWSQQYQQGSKGGGKDKGKSAKDQSEKCLYCGKFGHWKRDCYKYKKDLANGTVRQVADDGGSTVVNDAASTTASSVGPSHSVSNVAPTPRRVQMISRMDDMVDLTTIDDDDDNIIGFGGSLRVLQAARGQAESVRAQCFDISCGDQCGENSPCWSILLEYGAFDLDAFTLSALCAGKENDDDPAEAGMSAHEISASVHVSSVAADATASVHESPAAHVDVLSLVLLSDIFYFLFFFARPWIKPLVSGVFG